MFYTFILFNKKIKSNLFFSSMTLYAKEFIFWGGGEEDNCYIRNVSKEAN